MDKRHAAAQRHMAVLFTALLMLVSLAQGIPLGQAAPPNMSSFAYRSTLQPRLDCTINLPGHKATVLAEYSSIGVDGNVVRSVICNYRVEATAGAGALAGMAITIEYACPAQTAEAWKSKTETRRRTEVKRTSTSLLLRESGNYDVYAGVFTVHEKLFLLLNDRSIATIAAYTDENDKGGYNFSAELAAGSAQSLGAKHQTNDPGCQAGGTTPTPSPTVVAGELRAVVTGIKTSWFGDPAIIRRKDGAQVKVEIGTQLFDGDGIVSQGSTVTLTWRYDRDRQPATVTVGPSTHTRIRYTAPYAGRNIPWTETFYGIISFFFPPGEPAKENKFGASTGTVIVAIKGTIFNMAYDEKTQNSTIQVEEGSVEVTPTNSALKPFELPAGKQVQVTPNNVSPAANYVPVPGSGGRLFPETGKTVNGIFLDYWFTHGGLAQQGYPISEAMREVSDLDGKEYTVQYFERAVFEHHPEFAPPNNVLLSQLGTFQYKRKYPSGAPNQRPNTSAVSRLFNETGKRVGGKFLDYWNKNGGLAQQGLPLSDEFQEVSETNGKTYTVQYFERAVFEYHPENAPPNDVLLSLLGVFFHKQKYGGGRPPGTVVPATPAPSGPTATPVRPTTPPSGGSEVNITGQGDVFADFTLTSFPERLAVDGNRATSWFADGIEAQGEDVYFDWLYERDQDITISKVVMLSNAQHADTAMRRSHGFERVRLEILNRSGQVVAETSYSLAGTPDPDVTFTLTNIKGVGITLVLEGCEARDRCGFSELQVWGSR